MAMDFPPMVGLGTYQMSDEQAAASVNAALRLGYRHIDTADSYNNEEGVGKGLAESGVARSEVFITTKVWPGNPAWGMPAKDKAACHAALDASLKKLGTEYVDLYLIHAPFCKDERLDQWRAMLEMKEKGLARHLGVSNYSIAHLEEIKAAGLQMPRFNQIEIHPHYQRKELVAWMAANGVSAIAYSSMAPMAAWRLDGKHNPKSEADRGESSSEFADMASRLGCSEAQLLLAWGIAKGYPVLPKSTNEARLKQNLEATEVKLSEADVGELDKLERGHEYAWTTQGGDPTNAA